MLSNNSKRFFCSVVSDNPKYIFSNLKLLEVSGIWGIHFDVMDGLFVPRLGLYPELLKEIRKETDLFIEVHAMLTTPSFFIEKFVESGADRIIYHVETIDNLGNLLKKTKDLGVECGIALNPDSPSELLSPYLSDLDAVMLMAINPGIPKHPFIDETFEKLQKLRHLLDSSNNNLEIVIDGGVTFHNVEKLFSLGANTLICGSGTLFAPHKTIEENILKLNSFL
jgi:ribulose-phosphate 3-epimerase